MSHYVSRFLALCFLLGAILSNLPRSHATSPLDGKVIINEWSQASGDWVELLVTQTADLRGMWVCDSGGPDALNGLEFSTTNTLWSAVPAGTLIVFYDGGVQLTEDLDYSDYKMIVNCSPLTNASMWDSVNNHFKAYSGSTATDNPRLFDRNLNLIQDWDQGDNAAWTGALRAAAAGDTDVYTSNTAAGVFNPANWTRTTGATGTPGQPNGGANTTWINSLRVAPLPDPLINVAPSSLNYGSIDAATSSTKSFTIANNGATQNLNVSAATLTGTNAAKYSILTALPLNIAAGSSKSLSIRFNPAGTTGTLTAQINISSNDTSHAVTTATLTGTSSVNTGGGGNANLQGKVIINEWAQDAAGDWLEILVTQTADLRGMWVCDSGGPDSLNGLQFSTTNAFWASVHAGTLITIYDSAQTVPEDYNINDFNLVMIAGSPAGTALFDSVNNHFKAYSGSTATDNPRLFDSNKVLIHDWDQNNDPSFTGSLRATLSGDTDVYTANSAAGVSNTANWTLVTTGATPAQPNGGANSIWIQSLRFPPGPNAAHDWPLYQ